MPKRISKLALGIGVPVLAVVCCAGLPLLVAAGAGVALAAWLGGIAAAALVLGVVVVLLTSRTRSRP